MDSTVKDERTGILMEVPQADLDISGLSCGSGSTLCTRRAVNNASNMSDHSTGKDILLYTKLLDGSVPHRLGLIENTVGSFDKVRDDCSETDSEEAEQVLTTGEEWRAQLRHRGFSHVKIVQSAGDNGGPESRMRFYEGNLHSSSLGGMIC